MNECVNELTTNMQSLDLEGRCMSPAYRRYGGVNIYAPSEEVLSSALESISETINECALSSTILDQNYLLSLVRKNLGCNLDRKIFKACLGFECRLGNIHRTRCASINGKPFVLVVHSEKISDLKKKLISVITLSNNQSAVPVREVQDLFYPDREKGTWFVAIQIMQRLSYLGLLEQVDKWNFRVPDSFKNAKSKIGGEFIADDCDWLV